MRELPRRGAASTATRGDRRPRALGHSRASSTATRTRASAATASTSSRCAREARPTRSSTPPGAASSRRSVRRGRPARRSSTAITVRHRSWMRAHGTTTFEGKSGYGLDHDTELAQLRAVRAAGGIPTWLGAHTVPPEFDDADAYLDFLARGGPARGRASSRRRPTSSSSAARSTPLRRGATSRRAAMRGSRCACTATSSPSRARSGSRSSSARARSTTSRRRGRPASRSSPRATSTGVLLPASALFLGRPMPPARALVDAGALVALATDFNPGSAFCDSLPARPLPRLHPDEARARGGARRRDRERRPRARARRPDRSPRARASPPTSCCSTHPTGVTSPTTSPATSSTPSIEDGAVAFRRTA